MKAKNLISILAVVVMMITSITAFGQNEKNRVAFAGTAVMVSNDASNWGLEVSGKLVVDKNYKSFGSKDGKFFVVEAKDGKMGVCNDKGVFLFPCKYVKTTVSGSYIVIYEAAGTPKFYKKDNPTVEVQAKEMSASSLEDEIEKNSPAGTYINTTKTVHAKAEALAKKVSAEAPYGAFSFRTNSANKRELVVDGKVIFTANQFNLISDAAYYDKTTCWIFIVVNNNGVRDSYGLFILSVYKDKNTGNKSTEDLLAIPFEYSFIEPYEGIVKCITWSGGSKYFTRLGKPFDITKKGGGL